MNRKLYYLRNLLFLVTTVLFILNLQDLGTIMTKSYTSQIIFGIMTILLLLFTIVEVRSEEIKNNFWYNLLFILIECVMLIVYARMYFDANMVVVQFHNQSELFRGSRSFFLKQYLVPFNILYGLLIAYNITFVEFKSQKKKPA